MALSECPDRAVQNTSILFSFGGFSVSSQRQVKTKFSNFEFVLFGPIPLYFWQRHSCR